MTTEEENAKLRAYLDEMTIWFLDGFLDSHFELWCEYHGLDPQNLINDETLKYHRFPNRPPDYYRIVGAWIRRDCGLNKDDNNNAPT